MPAAPMSLTRYRRAHGRRSRMDHFGERRPARDASACFNRGSTQSMWMCNWSCERPRREFIAMPMSFHPGGRRAFAATRLLSLQAYDQRFGIRSRSMMRLSIPSIFVVGTMRICVSSPGARSTTNPRAASTFRHGMGRLRACCIGRQRSLTTYQSALRSLTSKAAAVPSRSGQRRRRE